MMRIVFCGTPEFAVPSLQALVDAGHQVPLVLTQPDRPAGRKQQLQLPPVKRLADRLGVSVVQPERLKNNPELRSTLEQIAPDAIVVVAYGRIIPPWMLDLPRFGNINVHGSLLPKYRGAAPIQWAVANGDTETGVTTMLLDAGLDTGDTLLARRVPIGPETTASDLYAKLAEDGSKLLIETLYGLEHKTIRAQPQDHAAATPAPLLNREDGRLDLLHRTAQETYNRWRGFTPWPGAHAMFRGKRFLIHRMRTSDSTQGLAPYQIEISGDKLFVGSAKSTALVFEEVQVEGKPRLSGAQFAKDFQVRPGESLT